MAFTIALVLVTFVARTSFASRKKFNKNEDLLENQNQATKNCPDDVAENPRGDCIDPNSNEIIPSQCCDDLRWCNAKVPELFELNAARIESYYVNCGLMPNDVAQDELGKFTVLDSTRICSPQCQNFPGLHDGVLPDYGPLEIKCADQELLPKLEEQNNFLTTLNDAYFGCTTTSTTNTLPTTINTTIAPLPYFDFTEFFGGDQAPRSATALFPDRNVYHCCCNPDTDRNSVHCVLKKCCAESVPEFLRRLFWQGCGGAMGRRDYHAWNNVFYSTYTGVPRAEFEGLENRGKCIVQNDELPTFLRDRPHSQIKEYLDN